MFLLKCKVVLSYVLSIYIPNNIDNTTIDNLFHWTLNEFCVSTFQMCICILSMIKFLHFVHCIGFWYFVRNREKLFIQYQNINSAGLKSATFSLSLISTFTSLFHSGVGCLIRFFCFSSLENVSKSFVRDRKPLIIRAIVPENIWDSTLILVK